jgi:murein DD-endopeptidase MepM/ murein hydrolase activator NlpD
MLVPPPYDREREIAAKGGNVVELWAATEDWSFEVDGALALQPEVDGGLKDPPRFVSVPRMVEPQAQGVVGTRAIQREQMRANLRRSRRTAALVVVAAVSLVTLLLTAFGTGDAGSLPAGGPAPAGRLLPAGPPRAQVVAMQDTLRIQLPISQSRVTAIGYHASGATVLPLEPVGSQANAGLFGRIVQRLFGQSGSGIRYYLLGGGIGPQTGGLDIGAPVQTDVYAPVDGTVIAISDQIVNGQAYGVRIDIQPSGDPDVVVALTNLRPDPALTVGSTVSSGRTKIGRLIDLSLVEQAALAQYTHDKGQHVHIEVHAASSLATP